MWTKHESNSIKNSSSSDHAIAVSAAFQFDSTGESEVTIMDAENLGRSAMLEALLPRVLLGHAAALMATITKFACCVRQSTNMTGPPWLPHGTRGACETRRPASGAVVYAWRSGHPGRRSPPPEAPDVQLRYRVSSTSIVGDEGTIENLSQTGLLFLGSAALAGECFDRDRCLRCLRKFPAQKNRNVVCQGPSGLVFDKQAKEKQESEAEGTGLLAPRSDYLAKFIH